MRISDWSSDVCSSDLGVGRAEAGTEVAQPLGAGPHDEGLRAELLGEVQAVIAGIGLGDGRELARPLPVEGDRKSVVSGKSVSVRVDLGGRRIIKKKKKSTKKHKTLNYKPTKHH